MTPTCLKEMTQNDWAYIARFSARLHQFALLQIDKLEIEKEMSKNGKTTRQSVYCPPKSGE